MRLYLPITVDLYNIYPLPIMKAQQYNIGRGALVTIVAAGQMVIPDNESLYIYAKKKDGTKVYANCTLSGNQVQVDFNEQMTAVAGILQMELQMIDQSGNNITTPIFLIDVQKSIIDYRAIVSSDDFQVLQEALAEVEELKKNGLKGDPGEAATIQIGTVSASAPGSSPQITNSGTESAAVFNFILPRGETGPQGPAGEGGNDRLISDAFSEEKAYAVGDYAIYENVLYKFTAAKTAGAWDATKVQAVTVAGELNSLNGNLDKIIIKQTITSFSSMTITPAMEKVFLPDFEVFIDADGIYAINAQIINGGNFSENCVYYLTYQLNGIDQKTGYGRPQYELLFKLGDYVECKKGDVLKFYILTQGSSVDILGSSHPKFTNMTICRV